MIYLQDKDTSAAGILNRNINYQVWTHKNNVVELDTNALMDSKLNYIHQNAIEAKYVEAAEEYLYSSVKDYADRKGFIAINYIY